MNQNSSAQKKLLSYLKKRDPSLSENELSSVLEGIKRFVNLTRKIYTEPQAKVTYQDVKIGKKIKTNRVFNTDLAELKKVLNKNHSMESIKTVMKRFQRSVTKKKHD